MTATTYPKTYRGKRTANGCVVTVQVKDGAKPFQLPMRFDLRRHSPTGYEWSYSGSGPAQLALALLADALGDDERALRLYQRYKARVVANLPVQSWVLGQLEIEAIARELEATNG